MIKRKKLWDERDFANSPPGQLFVTGLLGRWLSPISPLCPHHSALPLHFACPRLGVGCLVQIKGEGAVLGLNGPWNGGFTGAHFKRRYFPECLPNLWLRNECNFFFFLLLKILKIQQPSSCLSLKIVPIDCSHFLHKAHTTKSQVIRWYASVAI